MKTIMRLLIALPIGLLIAIAALDIWGALTLGTMQPDPAFSRDPDANKVVLVMGANGAAGDGLLKAAMEDNRVERVVVITRSRSERIDQGVASGRIELHMHKDFTDYSALTEVLSQVDTVLWGLGVSSLSVDDATFTRIQVDFPLAFANQWLAVKDNGPISFHYITGMGTEGDAQWAQEKRRAEQGLTDLGLTSPLRSYHYRSAFISPASERSSFTARLLEWLLRPGKLVIPGIELGRAMLEISARVGELPNGTIIDNADSIVYAQAYHRQQD